MKPVELNDDILLNVRRPARYIGREYNIVRKEWDKAKIFEQLFDKENFKVGAKFCPDKVISEYKL